MSDPEFGAASALEISYCCKQYQVQIPRTVQGRDGIELDLGVEQRLDGGGDVVGMVVLAMAMSTMIVMTMS